MWQWISVNANAIMAVAAILTLVGAAVSWFIGLWGSRKPPAKIHAESGGVVVKGDVKGSITTNPGGKRKP